MWGVTHEEEKTYLVEKGKWRSVVLSDIASSDLSFDYWDYINRKTHFAETKNGIYGLCSM